MQLSTNPSESSNDCPRTVPAGFSYVSDLNHARKTNYPTNAGGYEAQRGEFAVNNGVIVLADCKGEMRAMIPISNPDRREESMARFDQALKRLRELGYKETSFMVPFSNPIYEEAVNERRKIDSTLRGNN